MVEGLTVRPAGEDDIPEILEVLKAALGETPLLRRTEALFRWKHLDNPFGPSIVLVGEVGGRIAGVRALMRWMMRTPTGHELRCLRPVDTATHPDFARLGIFRTLTLEALDLARDDGVDLVFNTPNAQSGAGYLSMGWRRVGWIGVMVRPRVGNAVSVPNGQLPPLESLLPEYEPFPPVAFEDRPPIGLRTPRTVEYQRWRFAGHPTVKYAVVGDGGGVAVIRAGVRRRRTEMVLSDLLGGAGPAAVRSAGRASRTRYLAGWFSPSTPEHRAALRGGMWPVPGVRTLQMVTLPLIDLDVDVLDLGSWDLATSDLELL